MVIRRLLLLGAGGGSSLWRISWWSDLRPARIRRPVSGQRTLDGNVANAVVVQAC